MRHFYILIVLAMASGHIYSQDTNYVDPNYTPEKQKEQKQKKPFVKRMYVGGTFGIGFSSDGLSSVLIEPMVGFKLTEKLSTGVGIGWRYGKGRATYSTLLTSYNYDYTYNNYIGRVFARYIVIPRIYAHVEYMVESYDSTVPFSSKTEVAPYGSRTSVPFLFVGGGFRSPGPKGSFIVQILFNVLQDNENSAEVYPSGYPAITLGYIGGF